MSQPLLSKNSFVPFLTAGHPDLEATHDIILAMAAAGVNELWEIGAGKALSGMVRRIDRAIACRAVGTPEDAAGAAEHMKQG